MVFWLGFVAGLVRVVDAFSEREYECTNNLS